METVRVANCVITKSISTIRKLQSGDILLTTTLGKAREELKRKNLRDNTLASLTRVL